MAEPKSPTGQRNWKAVSPQKRKAVGANRRRMKRTKAKGLQGARSEHVEHLRSVLETGGARRTWLRGDEKVKKRYSKATAAYNLGVLMRRLSWNRHCQVAASVPCRPGWPLGSLPVYLDHHIFDYKVIARQ